MKFQKRPANESRDKHTQNPLRAVIPAAVRQRRRLRPLLIGIGLLLFATDAFARAGGGDGFSGGGGFSSSGSGGGGDGELIGLLFRLLIWLCIEMPYVGIPLLIVVIIVFIKTQGAAKGYHQGRTIRTGRRIQALTQKNSAIEAIRRRDPEFNPDALMFRIKTAFLELQNAWCAHDLNPVRQFISDGIHERFALQIAEQKEAGLKDHMEDIRILNTDIEQIETDAVFDTVTVRIRASAIDYKADLKTGKRVSGSTSPSVFVEYWSFIRRLNAKSLHKNGLMEGNCPNCGAGLELNETTVCPSCQALIKSGEYDWVLAEITQGGEWQVQPQTELPGVAQLQQDDPGFAIQHLEDRASVMFWRHIQSVKQGTVEPIRKMASDAFCEQMKKELQPDANGSRKIYKQCAVGSVKTLGLLLADGNADKALVQIRWSGKSCELTPDNRDKPRERTSICNSIYVLERQHGIKSSIDKALSSAHCPGCGAPAGEGTENACRYCGTVLNDGTGDWILTHIGSPLSQPIMTLRNKMREPAPATQPRAKGAAETDTPPTGGLELAAWMVQVMLADGRIDPKEQVVIEQFAAARNIPKSRIDLLIESARSGQIETPVPSGHQEAKSWMEEMARMALADGFVSKEEHTALMKLGKKIGYSAIDINQFIRKTRTDLFRESKAAIKDIKAARQ